MVVSPFCELGKYQAGPKKKNPRKGAIVRQGDIIKFGRVPIMIKESSIDIARWDKLQKSQNFNFVMDIENEPLQTANEQSRNQTFLVHSENVESTNNLYNI
jgi:hypothetical protein